MIKRIIIEGADQQGKTTLCKFLSKELEWPIVHFGKPPYNFNFLTDYVVPVNTISDRNFLSEVVYRKMQGMQPRVDLARMDYLFNDKSTVLILVDREEHFKFDTERHEDFTLEQIEKAREIYREEFRGLRMMKIPFNINDSSMEMLLVYLKQW